MAQGLAEAGYEIISTGGSAKAIEAAGVPVKSVDQLTGFPEMLDGTQKQSLLQLALPNASSGASLHIGKALYSYDLSAHDLTLKMEHLI